ncbi:hypothetical protein [Shewanella sp. YIC-542]|uniref:hypothetical protein n=1 Tax=Shewanella mytili TaxID=3377111 RepID=UPI00398E4404
MEISGRIKRLKDNLIKELPFFPNEKETLEELKSQDLNNVLIHYLHWKTRQVPTRVRSVQIAPEVTSDRRWKDLKGNINSLLDKVRNGEDLSPYLSKRAHKNGYTPRQRIVDGEADAWDDKDQILNTKGFHHFHLDMELEASGLSKRTDDVLFAYVTRDSFHAVGIFNHSVFESASDGGSLNDERERMWKIHEKHVTIGMEPGTAYMSNMIMSSGHPMYLIRMADHYADVVKNTDPQLEKREFVNDIYDQGKLSRPNKFKLEWHLDGLDLGIIDKKNGVFFNALQGPI